MRARLSFIGKLPPRVRGATARAVEPTTAGPQSFEWPPIDEENPPTASEGDARLRQGYGGQAREEQEGGDQSVIDSSARFANRRPQQVGSSAVKPPPAAGPARPPKALLVTGLVIAVVAVGEGVYIGYTLWPSLIPALTTPAATVGRPAPSVPSDHTAFPAKKVIPVDVQTPRGATGAPAVAAAAPPPLTQAGGRLAIDSDPPGAEIEINGHRYGVTPRTLVNVSPGEHRLVLRRDGTELQRTVRVTTGGAVTVVVPFPPAAAPSGWIAIASPIELDVLEDGVLIGTSRTPRIMLATGSHTLQFVNAQTGFQQTKQVQVDPGTLVRTAIEPPPGVIHLNALPWAEVSIDGKSIGETPIGNFAIPIGPHRVVFRHPELGEQTIDTVVKAGVPARLTANMRPASK
jgi:hypothetical protein